MQETLLDQIHSAEMEILREIDRICRAHGLTYFLSCGTLLGAVRHKGFIPWDEDMDVMMPREDYERFLQIAPRELGKKFMLDDYLQNPKYFNPFAKVRNCNTLFAIRALKNYTGPQGLWIDIFPMDYTRELGLPDTARRERKINICRAILCIKQNIFDWSKVSKFRRAVYPLLRLVPTGMLWKWMKKIHTGYSGEKKMFVLYGPDYSNERLTMPVEWFYPAKEVPFEDGSFFVPANSDAVLTQIYGDYMKIPPKDKQVTFYPMRIMLEDGVLHENLD